MKDNRREDATVKRSTPTTPQHAESSQPDVPPGRLSRRNYAPHLSDPDPPQKPMTREEADAAAERAHDLMVRKGIIKK
jgi:hypothetical protein